MTIIPDNDEPGREHAQKVAASLSGRVASVKVLELASLAEKGDVSDWLIGQDPQEAVEELCRLSEGAPEWVPGGKEDIQESQGRKPSGGLHHPPDLLSFGLHDAGNADRLIALYGSDLRYCFAFRKWLVWDGRRWALDESGSSTIHAMLTMAEFLRQATECSNADTQRFARASLNSRMIRDALELARPGLAVLPAELDADPWLLNCRNGLVDLRTGEMSPHDPAALITRLVHHDYDPGSKCPAWMAFLYRVMGIERNKDTSERMVAWLQKAVGYSITGSTREKAVFVCHGSGDNGKSTMLDTIRMILKEYSAILQIDSLMVRREESNNAQSDLTDLRGARFAMTSETEAGQRLAEGKLKRISQGMGEVKAVRKYENPIVFSETHKLWIDANHKPVVRGNDNAIWNRLHLIPFDVTIPKAEQDLELGSRLTAEAEGILAWLVAGAVRWHREGLGKPPEALAAGADWRQESDVLGDFINDRCNLRPEAETQFKDLYGAYITWCEENNERAISRRAFSDAMVERGCERGRSKDAKMLLGVLLQ